MDQDRIIGEAATAGGAIGALWLAYVRLTNYFKRAPALPPTLNEEAIARIEAAIDKLATGFQEHLLSDLTNFGEFRTGLQGIKGTVDATKERLEEFHDRLLTQERRRNGHGID